ncbi:MAG: DUF4145 domain-containing protein [Paludibacteraceae bacterium]|nr:DUF4145 domain-containing protein [Paludibacteraceae bacterium]
MSINRDLYQNGFSSDNLPSWECPTCKSGKLHFDKTNITLFETNKSKEFHKEIDWEPHLIDRHFQGTIHCSNPKCKETYAIAGKIEAYENNEKDFFYLNYIYPVIHIFELPDEISYEVEEALVLVFKLFWVNEAACANAIRKTVETILTDKNILKTKKTKSGKRDKLSLHDRIELFKGRNPDIGNHLMAVKWIGNAGSHESEIDYDSLLDGLDILELVLNKLYSSKEKEITQKMKQINQRKKPI